MARIKRSSTSFDPEIADQVWDAISVLRGKIPAMTQFARAITGRDNLVVDITTDVPHTRGNKVYIRPPLGLGAKVDHVRGNCGVRGDDGKQICGACQLREVIDFYLFHELGHVLGETQKLVSKQEIKRARTEALKLHPEGCEHHRQVMDRIDYLEAVGADSMTLGAAFNPWLAMTINSLEDCRVNELTFSSRPGMRTIFNLNLQRLLTEGSELGDGKMHAWTEAPVDMQFIVGLQVAASGYAFDGEFAPEVMEALADKKLVGLCQRAIHAKNVFQIFTLSLEVLKRAAELGYCKVDPCVVEPPREEPPFSGIQDGPESGSPEEGDADDRGEDGGGGEGAGEGDSPEEPEPGDEAHGGDAGTDSPPSSGEGEHGEGEHGEGAGEGDASRGDESGSADAEPSGSGVDPTPGEDDSASPSSEQREAADGPGDGGESGESRNQGDGGRGDGSDESDAGAGGEEPGEGVRSPDREADSGTGEDGGGHEGDSEEAGSGGIGEDTDAGVSSGNQSPGDNGSADGAADAPDAAGISGPDSQEGAATSGSTGDSDSNVNELEGSVRDAGSEQMVRDPSDVAHEQQSGREPGDTAGDEGSGTHPDELGTRDDAERPSATGDSEGDSDADPAEGSSRVDNPWDIPRAEPLAADDGTFEAPTGAMDAPSSAEPITGTPEDAARNLSRFLMHGDDDHAGLLDDMATESGEKPEKDIAEAVIGVPSDEDEYEAVVERLIELALVQEGVFDRPSTNVVTTQKATFPMRGIRWSAEDTYRLQGVRYDDLTTAFAASEALIGSAILHARTVFDANKRSHYDRNRKSGRINTRALARRAPIGDERLFAKKVVPKKRSYMVVLGGDASASTSREERNAKIKRCIFAQAELLHRLNVPWVGYMHSAYCSPLGGDFSPTHHQVGPDGNLLIWNYLLPFKEERDLWNEEAKLKLACINYVSQNLDGHTLQAYRKIAEQSDATDRVIMYYTDGEMPAENKIEETEILLSEIAICKRLGIKIVCVGIQTDSPQQYGLPTVRVDSDEDLIKVIKFLEEILTK